MKTKADDTVRELRSLEKRVEDIEKVREPRTICQNPRMAASTTETTSRLSEQKETAFLKAIRSIRVWPIEGNTSLESKVDDFFKNALCISERDQEQIIIEDIYPVRSSPRSRQHNEVCVVFRDAETRELILSYARNLSTYVDKEGNPTAGIRMEIPQHLLMIHKLLMMYGFSLCLLYTSPSPRDS